MRELNIRRHIKADDDEVSHTVPSIISHFEKLAVQIATKEFKYTLSSAACAAQAVYSTSKRLLYES